jgi:hypothetical protein
MSLKERKVIRLWRNDADVLRNTPEPKGGLTSCISLWLKPLRRAEARTEVRLNEAVVWIGCTTGSFHQGTLRPTRTFWSAPGFELEQVIGQQGGDVSEDLSALGRT